MYKDCDNKDVEFETILLPNYFKMDEKSSKVNIGPLIHGLQIISEEEKNPFERLHKLVRVCLQVIGTADLESSMFPNEYFEKDLRWDLFIIEEALSRCYEVTVKS